MNWGKVLIGGVVAGIAINIVDFLLHGLVMQGTYMGLPEVFTQEAANPLWFVLIAICIGIAFAILFSKTRVCWGGGVKGGLAFGACVGLVLFFPPFYSALVIDGFPYFLVWCQGGIAFLSSLAGGAVLALVIKRP